MNSSLTLRSIAKAARLPVLTCVAALAIASTAYAQQQVRVTSDRVTVWRPGFTTVAMVVNTGTTFDVVGRSGDWYEVALPGPPWQGQQTGFVSVNRVEPVDGGASGQRPARPPLRPAPQRPAASRAPAAPRGSSPFQGFVQVGVGRFTAADTFDAVLGSPIAPWFGGGVRVGRRTGLFVEGAVEHFQKTGERVFVDGGEVFRLGIQDKVFVTPLMGSGGFRVPVGGSIVYAGAGVGAYWLRERSDFADDGENVSQVNAAYRGFAGMEWSVARNYALGLEVQYTTVPDALAGGAAAALEESDLGGIHIAAKILFGR
jgi:hypothetical protein